MDSSASHDLMEKSKGQKKKKKKKQQKKQKKNFSVMLAL